MDNKNMLTQTQPEPSHNDNLQAAQAAPPSYSAGFSTPDEAAPPTRSAPIVDPEHTANGMMHTMEYARLFEPQYQQRIDYKAPFGDSPVPIQCPTCQQRTISKTKNVSGGYTL